MYALDGNLLVNVLNMHETLNYISEQLEITSIR